MSVNIMLSLKDIKEILIRRYNMRYTAFEIFLKGG